MIRKFGAVRDVHDVRDRMYRASPPTLSIPLHVDLREWGGPIKDQGEEGSCTGHAFSSAREWIARKYEKASPILSPQCLYVEELIADGSFPKYERAMPRAGSQGAHCERLLRSSTLALCRGQVHRSDGGAGTERAQIQD